MKLRFALISSLCFALAACGHQEGSGPASQQSADASSQPAATRARHGQRQPPLTAQDIAQIKAMGRTGLWSDLTEICSNSRYRGHRATLFWNVSGKADKVVVVLVSRNGKQRKFASGASIGRRQTGRWVRPGMNFKLLNAADHAELGFVAITETRCP